MASKKILDAVSSGTSTSEFHIPGSRGYVIRCAAGAVDVKMDSVVYHNITAPNGINLFISMGDEVELVATENGTTVLIGRL